MSLKASPKTSPKAPPNGSWTLNRYFTECYLADPTRASQLAPNSRDQYATDLRQVTHYLGSRGAAKVSDLSPDLLLGFRQWKAERTSIATANRVQRTILAIWRHAAEQGLVSPPPRIRPLREPKRIPRAWLLDEVRMILATIDQLRGHIGRPGDSVAERDFWRALLLFVLCTGFRIGATIRIPTADLDGRSVRCPAEVAKGPHDEWTDLSDEAILALGPLDPKRRHVGGCIFDDWYGVHLVGPHAGERYTERHRLRKLRSRMWEIIGMAGLTGEARKVICGALFHRLRKTMLSYVAASPNGNIEVARQLAGHSCESVTRRYIDPRICGRERASEYLPLWSQDPTGPPQLKLFAGDDVADAG